MIKITNLSKVFNKNKDNACVALDNLSLEIQDGELLAITGKSGSGKSTLLHILCGLIGDFSGEVLVNDINLANLSNSKLSAYRAKNIGIVMQDFYLIEECSVLDNVRLPLNFTKGSNNHLELLIWEGRLFYNLL